jgi:arsenite oxidase small subunit
MDRSHIHDRHEPGQSSESRACMNRRDLLLGAGAVTVITLGGGSDNVFAQTWQALKAEYPRKRIRTLSALQKGVPLEFDYPYAKVQNMLVKLGVPAGGGVGPASDIVAFNQLCTHMGASIAGTYKDQHQVLGPCPLHLTTFDLTRHGMVVSGHATESLPQIVLETEGDNIFAVGVMGLIYGHGSNIPGRRA